MRTPHTRLKRTLDDKDGDRRTANLHAMGLAFIRGQNQNGEPDYEHALKPGYAGPGQRFNELCSLPAVQQFYESELDTKSIDLGAPIAPVNTPLPLPSSCSQPRSGAMRSVWPCSPVLSAPDTAASAAPAAPPCPARFQ